MSIKRIIRKTMFVARDLSVTKKEQIAEIKKQHGVIPMYSGTLQLFYII